MAEIHKKIIEVRKKLQDTKITKSGYNSYAQFKYYELSDFLPTLNNLMLEVGINDVITINKENEMATLTIFDCDSDCKVEYGLPFHSFKNNTKQQDIQHFGGLVTYIKRYLYQNAFGITDGEVIDSINNDDITDYVKMLKDEINKRGSDYEQYAEWVKNHNNVDLSSTIDEQTYKKLINQLNSKGK